MAGENGDVATDNKPLSAEQAMQMLGDAGAPGSVTQDDESSTAGVDAAAADESQQADGDASADESKQADEAGEGQQQDDAADDAKGDEADGEKAEGSKPEKPSRGDARFAELSAKLHAKDEVIASKDSEIAGLKKQVEGVDAAAVSGLRLPMSYVSADEAREIQAANGAMQRKMFLLENIATGATDPVSGKELSPQEIGRELAGLEAQSARFARATMLFEDRMKQFLSDAAAGRAAREAKAKAPVKPVATRTAPAPVKPKVAIAPAGAAASRPVVASAKKPGVSGQRFDQNSKKFGAERAALMELADAPM